jgi:hypothetical protein
MEIWISVPYFGYSNGIWQATEQCPQQLVGPVCPFAIEVKYLPPCVHTGIRPPTAVYANLAIKDLPQTGFDVVLNRVPIWLALPPAKFGAVV